MTRVLLVLDFQNDIVSMNHPERGPAALERAVAAIDAARAKSVPVVFVRVAYRDGYPEVPAVNRRASVAKANGKLVEGSPGAELSAALNRRPDEPVVTKRRVGAFGDTELEAILRTLGAQTLVLCGLATSGAVLTTLRQAADRDYGLVVLRDACSDGDLEVHEVLMNKVFAAQADVVTTADFTASL